MTLISQGLRRAVVERAGGFCEYCRLSQASQVGTFPVDHVIPISAGGQTTFDNLALACPRCNAEKWTHVATADPETGELIPLFDPRRQSWSDHFRWATDDPVWIEARTAVGRATIQLLDLNFLHRRRVPHWLMALELHPPA